MTQKQTELIGILHDSGISYEKIAEMLEISAKQVKRECEKIERERKKQLEKYPICKECGVRIVYERKTRPRVFCSQKCKQAWWNKRRFTSGRASDETRRCPVCGKDFIVNRSSPQKYCSQECYHKGRSWKCV